MDSNVIDVAVQAYQDQRPGTSGLRKKVTVFQQPNYLENFVQAIYEGAKRPRFVVLGGDGRYFMPEAIMKIINVLAANGCLKIVVPMNGILSTPAASALIRRISAAGGIILTASHNPGGPDGDFGIKYNNANGAPAEEKLTEEIYQISKNLTSYKSLFKTPKIELSKYNVYQVGETKVAVVDPVSNYAELIGMIFDIPKLKSKIGLGKFNILVDCMNGVMGPYAKIILCRLIGCDEKMVINSTPLPDFGGLHPDPNLTYAKDLVERMKNDPSIQFGIAFDGDGDRNMALGAGGFFVSPGDSLAIIANNFHCISKKSSRGFARSFATSPAIDRVAAKQDKPIFVTPTGWKYFGALLDRCRIDICGEESFGIGSNHIREKDGLWACLAWLSIMIDKGKGLKEIVHDHWAEFGRDYFRRYDYENCDSAKCQSMLDELETLLVGKSLVGKKFGTNQDYEVSETGNWEYVSPIDYSVTPKQGLYVKFTNESRFVLRLSGTGSSGATIRLYLNGYSRENLEEDNETFFKELLAIAYQITKIPEYSGRNEPDVIT